MTQENVDLIRAVMDAYRDPAALNALADGTLDLSWVDPDIEWDASLLAELIPDLADVYHGHDGVRAFWRRWFDAWSELEDTAAPFAQVYTLRDEKLVRFRIFPDHESALSAVS